VGNIDIVGVMWVVYMDLPLFIIDPQPRSEEFSYSKDFNELCFQKSVKSLSTSLEIIDASNYQIKNQLLALLYKTVNCPRSTTSQLHINPVPPVLSSPTLPVQTTTGTTIDSAIYHLPINSLSCSLPPASLPQPERQTILIQP